MKKIITSALVVLTLLSCESENKVQVGYKTTMKVDAVFDGGKVARGEMISAKFKVENTGENPLILSDVKGSCSCTVAEFSEDPIAPGETGYIKAEVDTESFSVGPATRSITVLSNTTPAQTTIAVKAQIIK